MGRLFDAVSAMLDVCHYNSYEGQAPIELENLAATTLDFYKLELSEDGDCKKLFEDIADALSKQVSSAEIARGFIYAISDYICHVAKRFSNTLDDKKQIVLSGGTFLNRILLERTLDQLEADGFNVYISEQLPPGDGGICLGQAFLSSKS
jgi:hydrogenase maturation protein HypF